MSEASSAHDDLVASFSNITGLPPNEAREFLTAHNWDINNASADYFASLDEEVEEEPPRGPQPISTTSSMPPPPSAAKKPAQKKFATLGDLAGSSSHAGHGHSDEDDDDEDDQDLFAGGEKSGLAVHNPDDLKRKIIQKAKRAGAPPPRNEPLEPASSFTGTARTLGGDDTPSQVIEDPNANRPKPREMAHRVLHFWKDGFSIDDGELYRADNPENAEILKLIKSGRAPLSIMNVQPHEEVDVRLEPHETDYVKPKKKWKPFSGGGQRLGSPTPEAQSHTSAGSTSAGLPQRGAATSSSGQAGATPEINESEPIVSIQIRLGDGTRLVARFNTSHTIGDIYSFVDRSSPGSQGRPWALMTTFPSKELSDKSQKLGDLADFKRGGVVVQKWQ